MQSTYTAIYDVNLENFLTPKGIKTQRVTPVILESVNITESKATFQ